MQRKCFLALAIMVLSVPALALAQNNDLEKDRAAIAETVQYYFDAMKNDDAESLKKALHPKAKWFNAGDKGDLWEISQQRVMANLKSNAKRHLERPNASMKIMAIDITGSVAAVKIESEYLTVVDPKITAQLRYKGSRITEYLSLVRFDDGWKIVTRVYSAEPIPASAQLRQRTDQYVLN